MKPQTSCDVLLYFLRLGIGLRLVGPVVPAPGPFHVDDILAIDVALRDVDVGPQPHVDFGRAVNAAELDHLVIARETQETIFLEVGRLLAVVGDVPDVDDGASLAAVGGVVDDELFARRQTDGIVTDNGDALRTVG